MQINHAEALEFAARQAAPTATAGSGDSLSFVSTANTEFSAAKASAQFAQSLLDKVLPAEFAKIAGAAAPLVTKGLESLLTGEGASGLAGNLDSMLTLDGLMSAAAQFLPPWAGDAMAAGKALTSGDPAALVSALTAKFLPPELQAVMNAVNQAGGIQNILADIFDSPNSPQAPAGAWAARLTDTVVCPAGAGAIVSPGLPTVLIGGLPAARVSDIALCNGIPADAIAKGAETVLIGNLPAARMGDPTAHGGQIIIGFPTVHISKSLAECQKCLEDAATDGSALISGEGITSPSGSF